MAHLQRVQRNNTKGTTMKSLDTFRFQRGISLCLICSTLWMMSCTSLIETRSTIPVSHISATRPSCDSIEVILKDGERRCFAQRSFMRNDSLISGLCLQYDSTGYQTNLEATIDSIPIAAVRQINCVASHREPSIQKTVALSTGIALGLFALASLAAGSTTGSSTWFGGNFNFRLP